MEGGGGYRNGRGRDANLAWTMSEEVEGRVLEESRSPAISEMMA